MQLNEYLIRYNINKGITFGIAVVVAENINKANNLLKVQGNYNGSGYDYIILETVLINNTDQYNTSAILEEIATTSGDSAYDIAKKYGFKGTESEWLTSLKGDKGDKGEPLTWNTMDSKDKISLKEDIIKEIKSELSATPSGDPLHYAYESVGAVFNDDTGYWELNGLTDLTDDEMRAIYSAGHLPIEQQMFHEGSAISNLRTHLTKIGLGYKELDMNHFASYNSTIEVINLMGYNIGTDLDTIPTAIYTDNISYAFTDCNMLKEVYGAIHFTPNSEEGEITLDDTFEGCYNLETVYISNFGLSESSAVIYFTSSNNISESSIAYLIENACSDTYLEIYLTGYAFSRIETSGEVADAILIAEENGCTINIYNY